MAESSTRTVERALVLLGAVCDAGSMTLADASRKAELSASTALRLLRTLEATGFVRRDPAGTFRPGLRVVQLGALALSSESLVSLAEESLERLVELTGESAYLSVPSSDGASVYLAMREGTHSVRHASWVGRSIPLKGTAVGAVLTRAAPPENFVVVRNGVEPDVTAIAAPVSPGGRTVAALSVVVPSYRISEAEARRVGALVAREAAGLLGETGTPIATGAADPAGPDGAGATDPAGPVDAGRPPGVAVPIRRNIGEHV